jgi:hypothetical protein
MTNKLEQPDRKRVDVKTNTLFARQKVGKRTGVAEVIGRIWRHLFAKAPKIEPCLKFGSLMTEYLRLRYKETE